MQHIFNFLLVAWHLALLIGVGFLLASDLSWITKLLALVITPMVCVTGYSSWKRFIKALRTD